MLPVQFILVIVPAFQPLTLARATAPFSHPDWLFELKWDGFRSLVRIEQGNCKLMSRNGNEFKSFRILNQCLRDELKVRSAVIDGEIVCLNDAGKPQFRDLLFRRGEPRFVAFDLLWCDGQDLRYSSLTERKYRLRLICQQRMSECCTATTSSMMVKNCFVWPANTIWKALLRSGSLIPICQIKQAGSRSVTGPTRSGMVGRNFLTANERAIPICRAGAIALKPAKKSMFSVS